MIARFYILGIFNYLGLSYMILGIFNFQLSSPSIFDFPTAFLAIQHAVDACTCCSSASQRNWTSWKPTDGGWAPRTDHHCCPLSRVPRPLVHLKTTSFSKKLKQKKGKLCVFEIFLPFIEATNSLKLTFGFKVYTTSKVDG